MAESKLVVFEIISGKITHKKFDGYNYLQCKRIIEAYLMGGGKDDHLTIDLVTNDWKREDAMLFVQILNTMEPCVQDFGDSLLL